MDPTVCSPDEESDKSKTIDIFANRHNKRGDRPFILQRYELRQGQGLGEVNLGGVIKGVTTANDETASCNDRGYHHEPSPASDVIKAVDKKKVAHPRLNLVDGESGQA